jgi:hypothetical protein
MDKERVCWVPIHAEVSCGIIFFVIGVELIYALLL